MDPIALLSSLIGTMIDSLTSIGTLVIKMFSKITDSLRGLYLKRHPRIMSCDFIMKPSFGFLVN